LPGRGDPKVKGSGEDKRSHVAKEKGTTGEGKESRVHEENDGKMGWGTVRIRSRGGPNKRKRTGALGTGESPAQ